MSSETAIAVRHVSKEYSLGLTGRTRSLTRIAQDRMRHPFRGGGAARERMRALDDVTFDVSPGEAVGVIGKNGAGKSTLLKILSRITPPSQGHIEMAGRVGALLEVGTGFHQELTGIENVYLNGTILGMSKREIDSRLEEILDFADVHRFLETPVKRYSSGMRVRLAFAVAAHLDPEILIVDEVLSVGDYSFQAKCLDKMRSIVSDNDRTVLYVSHNLVTVENLCRRALLLVDGEVVFDGATEEAISKYLHLFPRAERGGSPGVFDLAAADRSEAGHGMLLRRLVLRPNGGVPSDTIRMGERLRIEMAVTGLNERPRAVVMVTVGSSSSQCLFRISSGMRPLESAGPRAADEEIVLDMPSVPLTPGDYHIDVGIWGRESTLIDEVRHAAEFSVVGADVFGSGYEFDGREGHLLVPWEWELRPSNDDRVTSALVAHDGASALREIPRDQLPDESRPARAADGGLNR